MKKKAKYKVKHMNFYIKYYCKIFLEKWETMRILLKTAKIYDLHYTFVKT